MAELFLGVARAAEGFERTVAIKRVLPHLAQEPDIARMFLAEARLSTQLQHQNIATVYDVGQGPEGLFLVMELVDGWDLGVLLRTTARQGRRFPPHLAAFIVLQALAGLTHAYRKLHGGQPVMVAHRDVSPSNVLVSREGEVKVTDFGIARLAGVSLTEPGVFKGKEAYGAPEVLQGAPANAASDQFSLGIVFYELLTGRHPFHQVKEPLAVAYAILSQEVPPPQDVPAPLAQAVLRMLARAPEARFPSPEALAELLARWLAQAGEPATSQTLSAFLRELQLPPTLRERAEAAGDAGTVDPGLATRPADPHTFALEPDLPATLGGAALSTSGRLVHRCTRCGSLLSAPRAPCDHCAAELAPPSPVFATPALPATVVTSRPASPGPAPDTLDLQDVTEPSVPEATHTSGQSVLETPAAELQLAERAPRPESDWEEAPAGRPARRWGRALALVGLVVALAGGGAWLWTQRNTLLRGPLRALGLAPASPVLTIHSEPPGAAVVVNGEELGTTPLALDNLYPEEPIPVQLRLKGYRPWKGTFPGGEHSRLDVKLQR
jgi:serine/threonine-protein kinase